MMDLSIIILSYNTKNLLDSCLASIYDNYKNQNFEIIVVDNSSTDDSVAMIKKKYPKVLLIESQKNLGYSAGNNLGLAKSQGRNILFLNSDTKILGDSLDIMVKYLDAEEEIGIIGPRLINPDQTLQKSVGNFYSLGNVALMLFGGGRLGLFRNSPDKYLVVDWISGSCMMVKRSVFKKAGLLDENLFMYMEEVEFCYRAKMKGILTGFIPEAKVIHQELGSSKNGREQAIVNIYKGLIYFYRKYDSSGKLLILKFLLKAKAYLAKTLGLITGNNHLIETYDQALRFLA
ncbi:glycosyltransferase family 2 protein [Candidatus Gottesmanbacteria bacterium]|nr:glycosyltransferase family 2 protein [Candidatus Gottesmanbacteria bacterium]